MGKLIQEDCEVALSQPPMSFFSNQAITRTPGLKKTHSLQSRHHIPFLSIMQYHIAAIRSLNKKKVTSQHLHSESVTCSLHQLSKCLEWTCHQKSHKQAAYNTRAFATNYIPIFKPGVEWRLRSHLVLACFTLTCLARCAKKFKYFVNPDARVQAV